MNHIRLALKTVGVFVLAFAAASAASLNSSALNKSKNFEAKMESFSDEMDSVQVVAFGSSHMENAFDPSVFERETGLRAFSFALPGVKGHQMQDVIRRVADRSPRSIQMVIIEVSNWPEGVDKREMRHAPSWLPPENAFDLMAWSILQGNAGGAFRTAISFANRYVPAGAVTAQRYDPAYTVLPAGPDGYRPMIPGKTPDDIYGGSRERMLDDGLDRLEVSEHKESIGISRLARIKERIEAQGITVLFVRLPNAQRYGGDDRLHEIGAVNLEQPNQFPEFYEDANRWDGIHMNAQGSRLVTKRISESINHRLIAQSDRFPE